MLDYHQTHSAICVLLSSFSNSRPGKLHYEVKRNGLLMDTKDLLLPRGRQGFTQEEICSCIPCLFVIPLSKEMQATISKLSLSTMERFVSECFASLVKRTMSDKIVLLILFVVDICPTKLTYDKLRVYGRCSYPCRSTLVASMIHLIV